MITAAPFVPQTAWTSCGVPRSPVWVVKQFLCSYPLKGPSSMFLFLRRLRKFTKRRNKNPRKAREECILLLFSALWIKILVYFSYKNKEFSFLPSFLFLSLPPFLFYSSLPSPSSLFPSSLKSDVLGIYIFRFKLRFWTHRFCIQTFFPYCLAVRLIRCCITTLLSLVFISLTYIHLFSGPRLPLASIVKPGLNDYLTLVMQWVQARVADTVLTQDTHLTLSALREN